MIADLSLRWVVTILFSLSALECGYAVAISHRRPAAVVGHSLHLVMAVAMAVMAWPRGAELPTTGPMVFFAAAAAWFLTVVLRSGGSWARLVNAYHAVMMLAMAWMYAVMNGSILPGQAAQHAHHEHAHTYPTWIAAINWFWTLGFAVAAVGWTYGYFASRQRTPGRMSFVHFGILCQAMIAAGMAIMFGVML
ncbi:DUF5134 domain-containing protein [Mycolicibacterium confluentis]|uniref:Uncharacterized protein n=1 Tax=Mycolicibacterium confluentis TaxID=28047 RepID=A0A7I7XZZ2_9MYCO|nr:DUF5134 domain-containing protein [Mycolicibacterium confluentis]MCV7319914.1 DUF5134 domain-containing protein [Mycolicibacterium confluentis]ORV34891.1 hypothetical protein AWB99_02360 [Mycolicibacterium confluentis]BBZ34945.1 hypothetical protein MCNF_35500 [Mycolicibacterium confluentis]